MKWFFKKGLDHPFRFKNALLNWEMGSYIFMGYLTLLMQWCWSHLHLHRLRRDSPIPVHPHYPRSNTQPHNPHKLYNLNRMSRLPYLFDSLKTQFNMLKISRHLKCFPSQGRRNPRISLFPSIIITSPFSEHTPRTPSGCWMRLCRVHCGADYCSTPPPPSQPASLPSPFPAPPRLSFSFRCACSRGSLEKPPAARMQWCQ